MKKKNWPVFSVADRQCFDLLELCLLYLFGCTRNLILEALAFYFCGVLTMKYSQKKQCFNGFSWNKLWLDFVPSISVVKLNVCNSVFLV